MKAVACLLIFGIIGKIETKEQDKARSVNLALETVFEFDKKDSPVDIQFIEQVQDFISNVKHAIDKDIKKTRRSNGGGTSFNEFLIRALEIIQNYDDEALNNLVSAIDNEIRKFHYKGCKFHELLENYDVRHFMANQLNHIKVKSIGSIRNDINDILKVLSDGDFNNEQLKFIEHVDSLYRYDGTEKLEAFLNNLKAYSNKYKRSELNIVKIIRNGLRSIIFDHYSNLKPNVRNDLKLKVETFWVSNKNPNKTHHNVWAIGYPDIMRTETTRRYSVARTLSTPSPKRGTAKNHIKEEINHFYDAADLFKTIKEYFIIKDQSESSQETTTARHRKKSKKKHKSHPQTRFELTGPKNGKSSDTINTKKEKTSHESKKKKNRKKHKRQRKHKNKEKKKHKHKSARGTVGPFESSETKTKQYLREQKYTSFGDLATETVFREVGEEKTTPISDTETVLANIEKKGKKELPDEKSIDDEKSKTKPNSSPESLEGNESFNRQELMPDMDSYEFNPSNIKAVEDPRKLFWKQSTVSEEGLSIDSSELKKKHSLAILKNNFTLPYTKNTKSNAGQLESGLQTKTKDSLNLEPKMSQTDLNIKQLKDTRRMFSRQRTVSEEAISVDSYELSKNTSYAKNINNNLTLSNTNNSKSNAGQSESALQTKTNDVAKEYITKEVNEPQPTAYIKLTTETITTPNDTVNEANISKQSKTTALVNAQKNESDLDRALKIINARYNDTLAERTQLLNTYTNKSQVLEDGKDHKVHLKIKEDLNKILGDVTTINDTMNYEDPLQDLEDMLI